MTGGWYEAVRGVEEVDAWPQLARLKTSCRGLSCVAEFGPRVGFFRRVLSPVGLQLFPKLTTVLFVP